MVRRGLTKNLLGGRHLAGDVAPAALARGEGQSLVGQGAAEKLQ